MLKQWPNKQTVREYRNDKWWIETINKNNTKNIILADRSGNYYLPLLFSIRLFFFIWNRSKTLTKLNKVWRQNNRFVLQWKPGEPETPREGKLLYDKFKQKLFFQISLWNSSSSIYSGKFLKAGKCIGSDWFRH